MPPIVTGNFNITSNCTINNTIKRIPYLEAVRSSFACKSKNTGIEEKRHSMTILSFRKTEILVIDKIRSYRRDNYINPFANLYKIMMLPYFYADAKWRKDIKK